MWWLKDSTLTTCPDTGKEFVWCPNRGLDGNEKLPCMCMPSERNQE